MAVTINFYDHFVEYTMEGGQDIDGDDYVIILLNSSHVFTSTHNDYTDISANELATANGYTQKDYSLASITWTESSGTVTWDAADVTWTASGGDIGPADDAVVFDETATAPVADTLVCSVDFGGSQTAGSGTNFVITWNGSGIFSIA